MSQNRPDQSGFQRWLLNWHIDAMLLGLIIMVLALGLFVLYSASGESSAAVSSQLKRITLGLVVMLALAQVNPDTFRAFAPWLYAFGLILLVLVLLLGDTAKGAQRWLDLGVIRFQPSELMKLAVPMVLAGFMHARTLPPKLRTIAAGSTLIVVPAALIMQQPDLGTALMIAISGGFVLFQSHRLHRRPVGAGEAYWITHGRTSIPSNPTSQPAPSIVLRASELAFRAGFELFI